MNSLNPEHLSLIQKGPERWNEWREKNMTTIPVFCGADLRGYNLAGCDLSNADFTGAILSSANLSNANLTGANLTDVIAKGCSIREGRLSYAKLYQSDLSGADLCGASLYSADIIRTVFRETKLTDTNFDEARLVSASFMNVDLSHTKGIDSISHGGPSDVDFSTLCLSNPLPLRFLRGCGLPDHFIEYIPSLVNQPIQFYSCFISYSSKDDEFARRLHADLQDNGVRCWFAPEDMKIGAKILDTIDEAIRLRDKVVLILSNESIYSEWVEDEVTKAYSEERRRKETVLFPIRIDDSITKTDEPWARKLIDNRNIGDFSNWKRHDEYLGSLERVLRDLKP